MTYLTPPAVVFRKAYIIRTENDYHQFKLRPKNTPSCHEASLLLRKNMNLYCDSPKPIIFYPEVSHVITDKNSCVLNDQDNI